MTEKLVSQELCNAKNNAMTLALAEIKTDIHSMDKKLSSGIQTFAEYGVRINHLEKVVYGALAAACLSILTAMGSIILTLVKMGTIK